MQFQIRKTIFLAIMSSISKVNLENKLNLLKNIQMNKLKVYQKWCTSYQRLSENLCTLCFHQWRRLWGSTGILSKRLQTWLTFAQHLLYRYLKKFPKFCGILLQHGLVERVKELINWNCLIEINQLLILSFIHRINFHRPHRGGFPGSSSWRSQCWYF